MEQLNVYLVCFSGHYIGGEMLVVDQTQRRAFNKAKKVIAEEGLAHKNKDFSMKDVHLIETTEKQVLLIDNGDY